MRKIWRWAIYGKPPEPVSIFAEFGPIEDPRTDALKAMAAAMQAQTLMLERAAAVLERAEERALAAVAEQAELAEGTKALGA